MLGSIRPKAAGSFGNTRLGEDSQSSKRRRGDIWTTPREAVWTGWLESGGHFGGRCGKASKEGRRIPVGVSEGGAKDTKVEEGAERCWKQLDWESHEGPELRFQGRGGRWERPTTRTWS